VRNIDLDDLLAGSRPHTVGTLTRLSVDVMSEATKTRDARRASRPWWKRPVVTLPIVGSRCLAVTAGAIAYSFGGNPDVVIPIDYVTDSGRSVSCGYALHVELKHPLTPVRSGSLWPSTTGAESDRILP